VGRGGFHLSLFGSDPVADFGAIVHDFEGRRINLARPESSLLLAKPTGQLDHGGDVPLEEGGAGAKLLLTWIKSGAPPGTSRRLKSIEISPRERLCDSVPALVPLQAIAQFDNEPPPT
jgi:hypothetical protein